MASFQQSHCQGFSFRYYQSKALWTPHCTKLRRVQSVQANTNDRQIPLNGQPILRSQPTISLGSKEEAELLWAGYSEMSERVKQLEKVAALTESQLAEVQAKLASIPQQQHHHRHWLAVNAAAFLLTFMVFINFIGVLAKFQVHMFVPQLAKESAMHLFFKNAMPTLVPLCNTAVVVLMSIMAIKMAWRVLVT